MKIKNEDGTDTGLEIVDNHLVVKPGTTFRIARGRQSEPDRFAKVEKLIESLNLDDSCRSTFNGTQRTALKEIAREIVRVVEENVASNNTGIEKRFKATASAIKVLGVGYCQGNSFGRREIIDQCINEVEGKE